MSIFPFFDTTEESNEQAEDELPIFSEYAYDFENNRLKKDSEGKTYLVHGNEALRIWIYKALKTERYRYVAYTDDYGSEIDGLIGSSRPMEVLKLELQRVIIEALIYNPYILAVHDFTFEKNSLGLTVRFVVDTVYSDIHIESDVIT